MAIVSAIDYFSFEVIRMKRSRKSSRRHKIVTASEGWDEYRFLETAFVPVVTEEGMGQLSRNPKVTSCSFMAWQ